MKEIIIKIEVKLGTTKQKLPQLYFEIGTNQLQWRLGDTKIC